jgi:hypothetical protein
MDVTGPRVAEKFPTFALYNFFGDNTELEGAKALLRVK